MQNKFKVLTSIEYPDDLSGEIPFAQNRIYIQSMLFEPGKVTGQILKSIKKIPKTVKKKVYIDWFSLLFDRKRKLFSEKQKLFNDLRNTGVSLKFTNKPTILEKLFPYIGRNHMKIAVVDDFCYVGGINLWDKELDMINFMVKIKNKKLSDFVSQLFDKEVSRDREFKIDKNLSLLVDSGKIGKSIILEKATEIVKQAQKEVLFMNQFPPDGQILKLYLSLSKNGVRVEGIIPSVNNFGFPLSTIAILNSFLLKLRKVSFVTLRSPKMVHAKLIIVDRKIAIFGSHNFTRKGVLVGTNEIAILTTNKELVKKLVSFYNKNREKFL